MALSLTFSLRPMADSFWIAVVLRWKSRLICRGQNEGATAVPAVDSTPTPMALRRPMNSLFGITVLWLLYSLLSNPDGFCGALSLDANAISGHEVSLFRCNHATGDFAFRLLVRRLFLCHNW